MNHEIIKECTLLSEQGKIAFPEVVAQLDEEGIELYYADLLIPSKTFYSQNEACVVAFTLHGQKYIGPIFNADKIAEALRLIQSAQISYQEFLTQIMEAGVVSYFVFIKGQKAIYFGKLGEQYIEPFQ